MVGDLSRQYREDRINRIGDSHFLHASIMATVEAMQGELGYEQAPTAAKLLIEQVLNCWLDLAETEHLPERRLAGNHTASEGRYWDDRLTKSQARYLRSLETLARVNRLYKVLPVQVNVATNGGQQVNMAALP
jgi:hypothetical protein